MLVENFLLKHTYRCQWNSTYYDVRNQAGNVTWFAAFSAKLCDVFSKKNLSKKLRSMFPGSVDVGSCQTRGYFERNLVYNHRLLWPLLENLIGEESASNGREKMTKVQDIKLYNYNQGYNGYHLSYIKD